MPILNKLFTLFERFIKRSLVPTSAFFAFFLLFDLIAGILLEKPLLSATTELIIRLTTLSGSSQFSYLIPVVLLMLLVGLGFLFQVMTQLFYDNWLKGNFNFFYFENQGLSRLRAKVITKLGPELIKLDIKTPTDYQLYLILAPRSKQSLSKYADQSKAAGIVIICILFNLFIIAAFYDCLCIRLSIYFLVFYLLGFNYIQSRYRSRAIRLYINYLLNHQQQCYQLNLTDSE